MFDESASDQRQRSPPEQAPEACSESLKAELAALEAMLPPAGDPEQTARAPGEKKPAAEPPPAEQQPRPPP